MMMSEGHRVGDFGELPSGASPQGAGEVCKS